MFPVGSAAGPGSLSLRQRRRKPGKAGAWPRSPLLRESSRTRTHALFAGEWLFRRLVTPTHLWDTSLQDVLCVWSDAGQRARSPGSLNFTIIMPFPGGRFAQGVFRLHLRTLWFRMMPAKGSCRQRFPECVLSVCHTQTSLCVGVFFPLFCPSRDGKRTGTHSFHPSRHRARGPWILLRESIPRSECVANTSPPAVLRVNISAQ